MGDDGVSFHSVSATWATIGDRDRDGSAVRLTRFATSRGLTQVFVAVPDTSAHDPGTDPGADALHLVGAGLHAEGIAVSAAGIRARWALDPRPFLRWIHGVRSEDAEAPGVDAVHLDVEAWRLREWDADRQRVTRGLVDLLRLAREAVPDLPLSADLPHWLAGEPYWPPPTGVDPSRAETPGPSPGPAVTTGGAPSSRGRIRPAEGTPPTITPPRGASAVPGGGEGVRQLAALPAALPDEPGMPGVPGARMVEPPTVAAPRRSQRSVFDEALRYLDAVTILVPRTHTHGLGGILDASARAREACALGGVPYLIGVEARARAAARSARPTFHDEGATALLREADRLAEALAGDALFLGVAVRDWAAWEGLGGA